MEVILNKKEKKLIKKVITIQLESLSAIIRNEMEHDLDAYCSLEGINKEDLVNCIEKDFEKYLIVYNNPNKFLYLDDKGLSLIKHILFKFCNEVKYKYVRESIWRKIELYDNFYFNYN